ncbi:S-layer homology domain-containing protein, partial [Cohnella sp. GCM10027633]|uniref:S-layer homology domain-containing protein n=1 Tax=unclassified Cohnella TaxID=2636738 RepID=UPI0036442A3C
KTEGENVALTVSATDEDDDTLAYSVSGLPNGANYTMNAGTGAFTWTAPAVGTHTLTFTASDGEDDGTDSVTITVTVTAATLPNHAPIISSPANGTTVSKTEGENVALTVSATDEDDDTLAYSVSGLPNGANYTMNAGTGAFSWTAPAVGTHTLTFTASDGEDDGTDSVTITVTVTAATQNPDQSGTVVVIPQEQRPVVITGGGIEVNIKPNNQGQASLELSSNEVKQAVANATGELKINVVGSDGADSVRLALPAKELAQHGSGAFALTIDTGLAAVTVPATTLANVIGDSDAKLELTVSRIEGSRLPEEAKQQVGRHPVFDLTITLGGVKVSRFGNNGESVEVRIPYQPTPNEEAHAIIVYYIADDGTLTVVNNGKYDATTGTVTFHTNHFSQYAVAYVPVSFEDLVGSQWAKQAIEALAARGIVKGFEEGEFRPQGNVTRAEYLTMLIGVLDSVQSARTNTDAAFTDVAPGAWYAEVVNIASELGIAKGRGDGTFGPNDRITRAEMAILLARTLKLSGAGSSATFADIASLSSEAREAITNAVAAGLLEGFSNGYFKPGATATRAQAAVVIYRVLNR